MRFYEYEAKALFKRHALPMGKSEVVHDAAGARAAFANLGGGPVVLKSQVLSGGRMKAGAVKFADNADEAAAADDAIRPIEVNGQKCRSILVEEKTAIAQEYFVAITWDGRAKRPVCVFSDMGGIDIEEVAETHPEHVSKTHFSSILPLTPRVAKEAVAATGVSGSDLNKLTPIVFNLMKIFLEYDLTKLVYRLSNPDRTTVGLLTTLPISGGPANPMQPQAAPQPWFILDTIQQLCELEMISPAATEISDEIDVLLVVHPKEFSDELLYGIDQYVLAG